MIIAGYPIVADSLKQNEQQAMVQGQQEGISKMTSDELNAEYQKAVSYNRKLKSGDTDIDQYNDLLNLKGNGVMCSIEIPCINVRLPIYHGTSKAVLEKGIGHMQQSSLPVGGVGTHSVLTGHSGLPVATLFSDLDKLVIGDTFYINVLGKRLAYKVDMIKVIEPTDVSDLTIEDDKDYVSLITCTPYGLNTHRLLVRGTATKIDSKTTVKNMSEVEHRLSKEDLYKALLIVIITVTGIVLLIKFLLHKRQH